MDKLKNYNILLKNYSVKIYINMNNRDKLINLVEWNIIAYELSDMVKYVKLLKAKEKYDKSRKVKTARTGIRRAGKG